MFLGKLLDLLVFFSHGLTKLVLLWASGILKKRSVDGLAGLSSLLGTLDSVFKTSVGEVQEELWLLGGGLDGGSLRRWLGALLRGGFGSGLFRRGGLVGEFFESGALSEGGFDAGPDESGISIGGEVLSDVVSDPDKGDGFSLLLDGSLEFLLLGLEFLQESGLLTFREALDLGDNLSSALSE